jgi:hypothetical protein
MSLEMIGNGKTLSVGAYAFSYTGLFYLDLSYYGEIWLGEAVFTGCAWLRAADLSDTKSVPKKLFAHCSNLSSVSLSGGVTRIGEDAFLGCKLLTDIRFSYTNKAYKVVGGCLIDVAKKCVIFGTDPRNLPTDGSVTSIGMHAFYGCKISPLVLPDTIESIGDYAFENSTFYEITLPANLKELSSNAFFGCSNLKTIYFQGTIAEWKALVGDNAQLGCSPTIQCKDGVIN